MVADNNKIWKACCSMGMLNTKEKKKTNTKKFKLNQPLSLGP